MQNLEGNIKCFFILFLGKEKSVHQFFILPYWYWNYTFLQQFHWDTSVWTVRYLKGLPGTWRVYQVPEGSTRYLKGLSGTWGVYQISEGSTRYLKGLPGTWRVYQVPEGSTRYLNGLTGNWRVYQVPEGSTRYLNGLPSTWRVYQVPEGSTRYLKGLPDSSCVCGWTPPGRGQYPHAKKVMWEKIGNFVIGGTRKLFIIVGD